ncbi:O-fucosyltransferase family protein [Klebsormidium nitens]|uniref:O-fucosyltransferase family protein n=1 Tax=Klebsormidium nitens TaxID=105231 RepID=A0A1Y1IKJ6_KLENI|nr:O-fucosyltransferase family protein [Klebsormidium nitens]|eukprot:GAQ88618.1 O-fucosyltransferase family protein [Klebsormidium nitens]
MVGITVAWEAVVRWAVQPADGATELPPHTLQAIENQAGWETPAQDVVLLEAGSGKPPDTDGSTDLKTLLPGSLELGSSSKNLGIVDSAIGEERGSLGPATEGAGGVWQQPEGNQDVPCIETELRVLANPKGHLVVHANGGLNQMRLGIADMVAIARVLEAALVVPYLDARSFWQDNSTFEELFDLPFFIEALPDDVPVVAALPAELQGAPVARKHFKTWSDLQYYHSMIAPLWQNYKVIEVAKTDTTLANNELPPSVQKLRCKVAFHALRFAAPMRTLADGLVQKLRARGPFVALHLRYEKDVLAFSGCTHGLAPAEADALTAVRLATPQWRVKEINPLEARRSGRCPLSPSEVGLTLRALGFGRDTVIYLASGELFGGPDALAPLREQFPNLVTKESLVPPAQLTALQAHLNQWAAVDYVISVASDVFVATFSGNMAKAVRGHRRFSGHRKTIHLQGKELIPVLDEFAAGNVDVATCWQQLAAAQGSDSGQARVRAKGLKDEGMSRQEARKGEEYFYANPLPECLCAAVEKREQTLTRVVL